MTDYKPIRYSGYRIALLPQQEQRAAWERRLEDIQWLLPYLQQALAEPLFTDDSIVDMPFADLVRFNLEGGELFGCVYGQECVGFVLLRDVKPGRDAWLEAYVVPKFRGKYPVGKLIQQIIDYAFRPWNPEQTNSQKLSPIGLGLRKLKTCISGENVAAARALASLGFITTGISFMDGLFKGRVTDIILLEKFNSLYFPRESNERKQSQATNSPDLRAPAPVPERAAVPAAEPGSESLQLVHSTSGERGAGDSNVSRRARYRKRREEPVGIRSLAEPPARPDQHAEHEASGEPVQPDGDTPRNRPKRGKSTGARTGRK